MLSISLWHSSLIHSTTSSLSPWFNFHSHSGIVPLHILAQLSSYLLSVVCHAADDRQSRLNSLPFIVSMAPAQSWPILAYFWWGQSRSEGDLQQINILLWGGGALIMIGIFVYTLNNPESIVSKRTQWGQMGLEIHHPRPLNPHLLHICWQPLTSYSIHT